MNAIVFEHVDKVYSISKTTSFQALNDISLSIPEGEFYGVIGSSGAGKSTLLRTVNGLEIPTRDKVTVLGQNPATLNRKNMRTLRRQIGMIFQHYNLLSQKTIVDNVAIPLVLTHTPKQEIAKRVNEVLDLVGLSDKRDAYPAQLSGGQCQRVGIARALITNPKILLCDEATSALDPLTSVQILQLLQRINLDYGITIMLITHQMSIIAKACNQVAVVDHGKILERGAVGTVFAHPKQELTRQFVGTVVPNTLSEELLHRIDNGAEGTVVSFGYTNEAAKDLVGQLTNTYKGGISLLYANEVPLRNVRIGRIILGFQGDDQAAVAAARRATQLRAGIECEVLHG